MTQLLCKDPKYRLGSSIADSEEIKNHRFFDDVNWDDVYGLKLEPPYIPNLSKETDLAHFETEFTSKMPVLSPCFSPIALADQNHFLGFSWTA